MIVCLLVDYTCVRNLFHFKSPLMPMLNRERMWICPHTNAELTVNVSRMGFLMQVHPVHVHLNVEQEDLYGACQEFFAGDMDKYNLITLSSGAPRIQLVEDLPKLQLQRHKINLFTEPNGAVDAINIYADVQYRMLL